MQHICSPQPTILRLRVRHEQPLATGTAILAKSNRRSPRRLQGTPSRGTVHTKNALLRSTLRKSIFHVGRSSFVAAYFYECSYNYAHKAMPLPPIPCHPAMKPAPQAHTPKTPATALATIEGMVCTKRTGHRQSGQNHHTYHPHRRHQSTRRLAYVHQQKPSNSSSNSSRAHALWKKAYEILLRLLHHRVLPAYLS